MDFRESAKWCFMQFRETARPPSVRHLVSFGRDTLAARVQTVQSHYISQGVLHQTKPNDRRTTRVPMLRKPNQRTSLPVLYTSPTPSFELTLLGWPGGPPVPREAKQDSRRSLGAPLNREAAVDLGKGAKASPLKHKPWLSLKISPSYKLTSPHSNPPSVGPKVPKLRTERLPTVQPPHGTD